MGIKHAFSSGKSDGADSTLVQPSNWNADHEIDETLDASSGTEDVVTATITVNQSGTAGYRGIFIDVTETATGSGDTKPLAIDVGGSEIFSVDNNGGTPRVLLPDGGGAAFQGDVDSGMVLSGGKVTFNFGGSEVMNYNGGGIRVNKTLFPLADGSDSCGSSSKGWSYYYGASKAAPGNPSTGFVMWLDSTSGDVEFKDSSGNTGTVSLT